jgi:hypothetical protein
MNNKVKVLIQHSLFFICVISAAILCGMGKEGWGWFLIVAVVAEF